MKTVTAGMGTHLAQEVTTLSTCWRVTRTDGRAFHFTDHDVSLTIDLADGLGPFVYKAESSYNRSALKNTDTLSVDNLDLTGVLDSSEIDETELRRGLFNFATVEVFLVNWADLTQGILKMRRGWLGEVTITPNGYFISELRGLTQAFSRRIGEVYSPECRADLGDARCKVPIDPPLVTRSTAYAVGATVKSSPLIDGPAVADSVLLVHADTNANSVDDVVTGTLGSQAAVQTLVKKFGAGAIEFTPSGSVNPSNSFVSYPDSASITLASSAFTIEGWFRFKSLASAIQTLASQWSTSSNQRAWALRRNAGNLELLISSNGSTTALTVSGAFAWAIDTWYHVAATRSGNTWNLWVYGTLVGTASSSASVFNSSQLLLLGKLRDTGGDDLPMNGFLDDFRMLVGAAAYSATFTPPVAAHKTLAEVLPTLTAADYEDRLYRCTVAGTTQAAIQPNYDPTLGNPTVDGTATFVAEQAWSRYITVSAVDGTQPRKKFTVTQLVPAAGTGIPGKDFFPDDSMNGGVVTWKTGPNAGRSMELRDFTSGVSQVLELFLAMPFDITIGDTAVVYRGCQKRKNEDCRDVFNNVVNMRAEPFVPGQDRLFQYPDAKG